MASQTSIEWTEVTWNPVTGCDRVSPGCDNCYALTLAKRLKAMGSPRYQNDGDRVTSGPGFGLTCHDDLVELPHRWKRPRLVFVNSMSDLFHPEVPDDFILRVFDTMKACDQHTFQILTKRPQRLAAMAQALPWPANIWMGVSVESAPYRFRIKHLTKVPAKVRFVSFEPLIEDVGELDLRGLHWVIVGGESGPRARPLQQEWVTGIRDQCVDNGVAFFFKQWGGRTPKAGGRTLEGELWDELPVVLDHYAGRT